MQLVIFEQPIPATTWTINHGLGSKVAVDVAIDVGGDLVKVYPANVVHVTDNQLVLTFSTPQSGKARVIGSPL